MDNIMEQAQWFIITAIGGKEDSIAEAIKDKVHNYGYDSYVGAVRIFKIKETKEDVFPKESNQIPANPKKTKTTEWQVLPDGKYKRIRVRVVNKFPGYIFINMIYVRDVWFAIRNVPGVLGFVGSSGKGAAPIPITIEEYAKVSGDGVVAPASDAPSDVTPQPAQAAETAVNVEEKKTFVSDAKVGQTVEIFEGSFVGMTGDVKKLDNTKGIATIVIDFFGRSQEVEIPYNQFKLSISST